MNARLHQFGRGLLFVAVLGALALVTGCGTTEPDNQSSRPWNSPKSWEGGVPGMTYDRR